ncbi:DNA polymerase 3'-5' exonuclease region [Synechococcus T7-like phage S-TIP37]|uniref:DNA polymerase 3'-5' exonuclease region n=1 Tax=Synechococcus T7-like phage S-TIP37 TaxID=1332145 RepID=A0A345AY98_9CAUD|nr:DNA polymerase exonuclease subunit [Synechococcus T7-like phage S-TIP37]AXF42078.1 DNA polymerase 3'-5' exonuclease region [Synechococcus T7-like phage S-TIP37]
MLVFDLESDGLLDDVTRVHCLVIYDTETDEVVVYNDQGDCEPISRGVQRLEDTEVICGHNVIGYDIPVLQKIYPWFQPTALVVDTLLLSRLYHADILDVDRGPKNKSGSYNGRWKNMPSYMWGRHSLESYGYRLGEFKGSFGKDTDWKTWSQEMQDYCVQDVNVTKKLCEHFHPYLTGLR